MHHCGLMLSPAPMVRFLDIHKNRVRYGNEDTDDTSIFSAIWHGDHHNSNITLGSNDASSSPPLKKPKLIQPANQPPPIVLSAEDKKEFEITVFDKMKDGVSELLDGVLFGAFCALFYPQLTFPIMVAGAVSYWWYCQGS